MPDPEFKEWVSLIKDGLLAIAALVTIGVGIYGARVWKMELIGKEVYAAARELVKQSHIVCKAADKLRLPTDALDKELNPHSQHIIFWHIFITGIRNLVCNSTPAYRVSPNS